MIKKEKLAPLKDCLNSLGSANGTGVKLAKNVKKD